MAFMTPSFLSILLLLYAVDLLFSSYQLPFASWQSYQISFLIALGSLFTPSLLIYIPIFWIGLSMMRSLDIKAFLASMLGIITIYWLALVYGFLRDDIISVYSGLLSAWDGLKEISVLKMDVDDIVLLILGVVTVIVTFVDYYANSFKDKIRTRTNLLFLNLITLLSILIYLFLALHLQICLMVTLAVSGLTFSHFFALADKKWKIYFFLTITIVYFGVYFHLLLKV